ncbi:MAG TPA: polysaccharide biosynthesis/export family protein [Candidatus Saccharicenans sp.]|nr:polysaccharide biosynthesis/export family protein [Candidatus Saccharicenans sp.]HQO75642.1 polysaccharide biosynthesis/export family protein [Candidatus Saccharicenans sp.]HUM78750.1 polysaccharide biosynthesis/export family protein [Candidatus Saccharicenans sp.]
MREKSEMKFMSFYSRPAAVAMVMMAMVIFSQSLLAQQSAESQTGQIIEYKIGSKDLLEIKVYELPELNQTVRVAEDGTVSLAVIGKVQASGLTAQELEKKLAAILDEKYTKNAHVTVIIREHQKIAVIGAVGRPGLYEMAGQTSLLQILSEAGGLTPQAGKEIHIMRQTESGEKERLVINVDQLMRQSNDANILLQPKDEIIVPFDQQLTVYVYGEVRNPGAIQFMESKKITLLQAVAQAGGLTEWANAVQVLVKRKDAKTGKDLNYWYNLKKIINGSKPDVYLQDGDVVVVH